MRRDPILQEELESLGYTTNFHSFLKGNDINYFLANDDLEIGVGGDMPTLRSAASDDVFVVSLVEEGFLSIISRDIREVQDLKGKKIAYPLGSNTHFYLLNCTYNNYENSIRFSLRAFMSAFRVSSSIIIFT